MASAGNPGLLHRDPPKGVGDGADEDNRREDRTQEADHGAEHPLPAEGAAVQGDFLGDAVHAGDPGDQDAAGDGRDGHHDGVGQEIEKVQELHPDDGNACQRAVAQAGQAPQGHHGNAHDDGGLPAAPAQLVLEGGDGALRQGDGAGQGGEEHQQEEGDADDGTQAHGVNDLGNGDEHEGRASLQGIGVPAGEGEHGGNDHKARHDGDGRVKDLHVPGGILNGDLLFHIGAEGDEDAHGDGQGVEHLAHGGHHRHPGEILQVGHQEVFDPLQGAGAGHGVHADDQGQHHQNGHHEPGHPLDAVFNARKNNSQGHGREDQETDLRGQAVGDEGVKVTVLRHQVALSQQVFRQVLDDPPTDHGVVGHDQNGDDGVDPAAEAEAGPVAEGLVGPHRAFAGHAADGGLGHDHGIAEGHGQNNIDQQEDAAAVFGCQIGKAPDVPQADGRACGGQDKADLAGKRTSFLFM